MNPALYAMRLFQADMAGQAEASGLVDDDAVAEFITDMRREARDA